PGDDFVFDAVLGVAGLRIDDATISMSAGADVSVDSADRTLSQLTSSGLADLVTAVAPAAGNQFDVQLPPVFEFGGFSVDPNPVISLTLDDGVFSGDPVVPGLPPSLEVLQNISTNDLAAMLDQTGNWLDGLVDTALVAQEIKLVDQADVSSVIRLKEQWDQSLATLRNDNGELFFATIQEFEQLLLETGIVSGIRFNPTSTTAPLLIDFDLSYTHDAEPGRLNFDREFGQLNTIVTVSEAALQADVSLQFTVGHDLTALGSALEFQIDSGSTLDSLNGGTGVRSRVSVAAEAPDPVLVNLASDLTFTVTVNTVNESFTPISVTVSEFDTSTNNDLTDLAKDVNRAVQNVDSRVNVEARDGRLVIYSTDPEVTKLTVTGAALLGFIDGATSKTGGLLTDADDPNADFRITLSNGDQVAINLDGLTTLGQVIDAGNPNSIQGINDFNTAKLVARIDDSSSHITLIDKTHGTGDFYVESVNGSMAAGIGVGLGLAGRGRNEYDTGTISVSDGIVSLDAGAWPEWVQGGEATLVVDGQAYGIASRVTDSGTQVRLSDTGVNIAGGTLFQVNGSLQGAPLHGDSLSQHTFIQRSNTTTPFFSASVSATANDVDASARFAGVQVSLGNGPADVDDPATFSGI
ncbi:MAG: hypothetical protein ABGZ17_30895, partial [Planctomycetaceae bacterium]